MSVLSVVLCFCSSPSVRCVLLSCSCVCCLIWYCFSCSSYFFLCSAMLVPRFCRTAVVVFVFQTFVQCSFLCFFLSFFISCFCLILWFYCFFLFDLSLVFMLSFISCFCFLSLAFISPYFSFSFLCCTVFIFYFLFVYFLFFFYFVVAFSFNFRIVPYCIIVVLSVY